ncbi:MAG: S-layer homology domain-containing protein [Oscillospiraceae bacterium]
MRKFTALLLSLTLIIGSFTVIANGNSAEDIIPLLSELNIMNGGLDGDLRLDDLVSRAEFTKMAVASSKFKNSVATNLAISPFRDVTYTHWAAPYVKAGVSSGLATGYPDGSFIPDAGVLYEEAITMMLRVLGYTDEDFGVSWPYGQLGLADNLGITESLDCAVGFDMTRRDVAILCYNTLNTKIKDTPNKLISIFDVEILEDIILIASNVEDSSVSPDKILTSKGTYKINENFDISNIGKKGDLSIKNGDTIVAFTPLVQVSNTYTITDIIGSDLVLDGNVLDINSSQTTYYKSQTSTYGAVINFAEVGDKFKIYSNSNGLIEYTQLIATENLGEVIDKNMLKKYIVYSILDNKVVAYKDGKPTQLEIENSTKTYKDKNITTYAAVKPELKLGDILYVKEKDDKIEYISYEEGSLKGPLKISNDQWRDNFGIDSTTSITRDGNVASENDITLNDIVYYSKDLNMLMAYSAKVTGVYEKALPNKDMPNKIVVSGVEYTVESPEAFTGLSSSGKFVYGDTITILLGRNNQIADVISPTDSAERVVGYIFETGSKEIISSDTSVYTSYYIKIASPDGGVYEYVTDWDYADFKNTIVEVLFSNGTAKIKNVAGETSYQGIYNFSTQTLGDNKVSKNVQILDISTRETYKTGAYTTVFPKRLDKVNMTAKNILYAEKNEKNEITKMILDNVTGDSYKYGIVTDTAGNKNSPVENYSYLIDGKPYNWTSKISKYAVSAGDAVKITPNGMAPESIQKILKLDGKITVTSDLILTNGIENYQISDKVSVYKKKAGNPSTYNIIPLSEVINTTKYDLMAYYDKTPASGGRIRIIVAIPK